MAQSAKLVGVGILRESYSEITNIDLLIFTNCGLD